MFDLFLAMFKEEWRMHSTLFGSLNFALFPILIFAIAFMGSFLIPIITSVIDTMVLGLVIHAQFALLGIMVGSFGILGKEVMNRRLGQASLVAYSARSLPVPEKVLFLNFVVKDILYYFLLWIFPFGAGFLVASPVLGISIYWPLLLLLTSSVSFLAGLCTVFLLSAVYVRSKKAAAIIVAAAVLAVIISAFLCSPETVIKGVFLPLTLFPSFSYSGLAITLIIIAVMFLLSIEFFTPYDNGSEKHHKNLLDRLTKKYEFFSDNIIVAKDFVDLYRSGIGLGQTVFSFLLPLCLIWLFLSFLGGLISQGIILFTLAVVAGVISSTMYTWLTEFDSISAYYFLPLKISSVIEAKAKTFTFLQVIPVLFLSAAGLISGSAGYVPNAVVLCLSISFFELGLTIRLCGLEPGNMIYNVRVFLKYMLTTGPLILVLLALTSANPLLAYASVIVLIPAWLLLKSGFKKWDEEDFTGL
ncbi:hypothetical protein J2128_001517 [Methanomicrobium sp. W14]|uniref:hypothetical protein n=1 Tax=Methanomicrobium sp. W14 TaxID=2817839 RepID=UPI001AE9B207|nr:hypothetical protein [Methanomicrobium sp. W14]MBP2133563.1 hypothetical protein [Methanomicrobium sp. W14]